MILCHQLGIVDQNRKDALNRCGGGQMGHADARTKDGQLCLELTFATLDNSAQTQPPAGFQPQMAQDHSRSKQWRGYFGIGAERISKPLNLGNLIRSAHAFGASFVFTVGAAPELYHFKSDTSKAGAHLPYYHWESIAEMRLPQDCRLVGVELMSESVDLPSFAHPLQAAYVLGPELGSLSPELVERCDHLVRIPTEFCINVAMAGAIVMYDRMRVLGRFPPRPLTAGVPLRHKKV
jgi:tRNA G18 (ribose-2'-O)-methylase SpoU